MNTPFLTNKYSTWYFRIISNSQTRQLPADVYTENHHILPKSFGGSNCKSNLARLTAKEHFICHLLLLRMTTGDNQLKMLRALNAFSKASSKNPRNLTANQYQKARLLSAGIPGWNKGKTIADYSVSQQKAMRKMAETLRGRTQTAEANAKRSATLAGRIPWNAGISSPIRKVPCPHCTRLISSNNIKRHISIMHLLCSTSP